MARARRDRPDAAAESIQVVIGELIQRRDERRRSVVMG
jgi:hypothetical protein